MGKTPRNYPNTMPSPESGRPITRGEKLVSFKIEGKTYTYLQPGWWCSLTDPDDMEGQLVEEDNQVAEMAGGRPRSWRRASTCSCPWSSAPSVSAAD